MAKKRAVKKAAPKQYATEFRADPLAPTQKLSILEKAIGAVIVTLVLGSISFAFSYMNQPAEAATIDAPAIIAAEIGLASIAAVVPPTPVPSGKCENCGGTGKVGDGTVSVPCAVCDGDGYTGFSLDLPPFPAAESPPATIEAPSPPASQEPVARRNSASLSCASGSCGVSGGMTLLERIKQRRGR